MNNDMMLTGYRGFGFHERLHKFIGRKILMGL